MIQKKEKQITLAIAGLVTAIASLTIIPNLTFIRRLITYPKNPITNVDWYQPLELVPGKPRQISTAKTKPISRDSLNQIADYARKNNSSALLVLHRGELVLERYWQGFSASSTFNSMSLSKTIVALLLGIAIAEGDIESELEPVANYITEWSNNDRRNITIQNLLYMQSGLENKDNTANPFSDLVQMYAGKDADAIALDIPIKQEAQTVFDYNSGNTQILSEVIERATGEKYTDYLASKLWQPLEANDAYLWLDRVGGNPKPFCCLFATPRDWAKVGQLWLDGGTVNSEQIVSASWLEKMLQPSPIESKYGYHIWLEARTPGKKGAYSVNASESFREDTFYLDGASLQRVYIVPDRELVIVRVGEDAPGWDDSVVVNTLIADLQNNN